MQVIFVEKVRVMVVDDSKISRMMISSMLAKTNFEVCAMARKRAMKWKEIIVAD